MAVAKAIQNSKFKIQSSKFKILRRVFKAVAVEARYAGINTIFAPVLDINTNSRKIRLFQQGRSVKTLRAFLFRMRDDKNISVTRHYCLRQTLSGTRRYGNRLAHKTPEDKKKILKLYQGQSLRHSGMQLKQA